MTNGPSAGSESVGSLVGRLVPGQVAQLHWPEIVGREEEEGEISFPCRWHEATELLFSEPKNKNALQSHKSRAESLEEGSNHKTGWSHLK